MTCPRCNLEHPAGTIFCTCGTRLTVAPDDPSAAIVDALQTVNGGLRNVLGRIEDLERASIAGQRIQTMALDGRSLERHGFECLGEFIATTRFAPHDNRLAVLAPTGERALNMGSGSAGGFLVPPQFSAELMDAVSTQSIVRPRARHVGTGGPASDAEITLPVLDISGAKGVRSGVHCHWIGEAASKPDTEPSFAQVTLRPSECAAMVTCSDKLLRNAQAATGVISFLLAEAIRAEEDACFIAGDGVAKPQGFMGHACSIEIPRAGAGTIVMADIEAMLMAARAGRPYVWLGSRTILGQLMELTLTGGAGGTANPIWLPSAREGLPSTLMGLPLLEPEGAPTLGNLGDLCLCDFGFYLIRDGFGPEIRTSDAAGTNFATNQTSIKITFNVDGQPWLRTPIRRADGTDCSPFVVLN